MTVLNQHRNEQGARVLPGEEKESAAAFQRYLKRYHLSSLKVALASKVRYMTTWNIEHGRPVTREHAEQVRQGLWKLTGIPYSSPIAILPDNSSEQGP